MKHTQHQKDLIRRYLIWCYKTTKEDFDRIERYFTQLEVDSHILKQLRAHKEYKGRRGAQNYRDLIDQFEEYMGKKKDNVLKQKYVDKKSTKIKPQYYYLKSRLKAIESSIVHFLGKKEKSVIRRLYEEEMTSRILQAREHS